MIHGSDFIKLGKITNRDLYFALSVRTTEFTRICFIVYFWYKFKFSAPVRVQAHLIERLLSAETPRLKTLLNTAIRFGYFHNETKEIYFKTNKNKTISINIVCLGLVLRL